MSTYPPVDHTENDYGDATGGVSLTALNPLVYDSGTSTIAIYPAGSAQAGYVSIAAQNFAGAKEFDDGLSINGSTTMTEISNDPSMVSSSSAALVTEYAAKNYTDTAVTLGVFWLKTVRLATAAALPTNSYVGTPTFRLTATANGALSVDSVAVAATDRILVKDETIQTHNGVYDVIQIGDGLNPYILQRSADNDSSTEIKPGQTMNVSEGTVNGETTYHMSNENFVTLDTDIITYVLINSEAYMRKSTSATDSAFILFNGTTGKLTKDSAMTYAYSALNGFTMTGSGAHSLNVEGNRVIDQPVNNGGSPTFGSVTCNQINAVYQNLLINAIQQGRQISNDFNETQFAVDTAKEWIYIGYYTQTATSGGYSIDMMSSRDASTWCRLHMSGTANGASHYYHTDDSLPLNVTNRGQIIVWQDTGTVNHIFARNTESTGTIISHIKVSSCPATLITFSRALEGTAALPDGSTSGFNGGTWTELFDSYDETTYPPNTHISAQDLTLYGDLEVKGTITNGITVSGDSTFQNNLAVTGRSTMGSYVSPQQYLSTLMSKYIGTTSTSDEWIWVVSHGTTSDRPIFRIYGSITGSAYSTEFMLNRSLSANTIFDYYQYVPSSRPRIVAYRNAASTVFGMWIKNANLLSPGNDHVTCEMRSNGSGVTWQWISEGTGANPSGASSGWDGTWVLEYDTGNPTTYPPNCVLNTGQGIFNDTTDMTGADTGSVRTKGGMSIAKKLRVGTDMNVINDLTVGGTYPSKTTTKGDLIARNATVDTRLPVGTDSYVLSADSTQATGLKWVACTSSSTRELFAADFLLPNNSDWAVVVGAPAIQDATHNGISVRAFDDSTEEGVGGYFRSPAGTTTLSLSFESRGAAAGGGNVILKWYMRTIPNNAVVGSWSAGTTLTTVAIPTNQYYQYDSDTVTVTANTRYQFELTRDGTSGSDTLTGDWLLINMRISFS